MIDMVFVYHPDALDRLITVEGEDWKGPQQGFSNPFGFKCFLKEWWEVKGMGWTSEDPIFTIGGDGYIHGSESSNHRYKVLGTGEVVFVAAFSTKRGKAKASAAGFRIV